MPICSDPAQAFSLPEAACAVAVDPLRDLVAALLCKLLDPRVPALPDGSQLLKALNVLMLKILDFSDRCALSMLRRSFAAEPCMVIIRVGTVGTPSFAQALQSHT